MRDFEESWFEALRSSDANTIRERLQGTGCPRLVLPRLIDSDGRVALHYAAGKGDADIASMLLSCPGMALKFSDAADGDDGGGSDSRGGAAATPLAPSDEYLNLRDTLGYTPLHMAAGYGHVGVLKQLLKAGGDPEIEDNQGNTVLSLVEDLRRGLPVDSPQAFSRRAALDGVLKVALETVFDEIEPLAVLEKRQAEAEAVALGASPQPEYLVRVPIDAHDTAPISAGTSGYHQDPPEGFEDVWVRADDVSPDLRFAFDQGLEVAYAVRHAWTKKDKQLQTTLPNARSCLAFP